MRVKSSSTNGHILFNINSDILLERTGIELSYWYKIFVARCYLG